MFVAPPMGNMEMSSAPRFRPRRSASVSSETWSLTPSTSTTAREPAAVASACAVAATSVVPPLPSAGSRAGGWNCRLSFNCLAQKVNVACVRSLVLFARHPQLPRFRYNGHERVHFPRCRLSCRLAGQVSFDTPRDSRAAPYVRDRCHTGRGYPSWEGAARVATAVGTASSADVLGAGVWDAQEEEDPKHHGHGKGAHSDSVRSRPKSPEHPQK